MIWNDTLPAGRPNAGEFALARAVAGDALHGPAILSDLVFHYGVEIREDTQGQGQGQESLRAARPGTDWPPGT
jgi:hypothetical protein